MCSELHANAARQSEGELGLIILVLIRPKITAVQFSFVLFSRSLQNDSSPCVSGLLRTEVRDGFMHTGTPKVLCCKHGGSRVKLSLWPFCGRIPGPTDTIWASFES